MARLALNKATLTRQARQLKSYQEFLPSLDLKRRQLLLAQSEARWQLADTQQQLKALEPAIAEQLPMLSGERVDLSGIVSVRDLDLAEENVVGTRLPRLERVHFHVRSYGLLGKPHWVDKVVDYLKQALRLRVEIQIAEQRLKRLEEAVRIITQRVNLFEKVLIPRTQAHIKKIRIHLSDAERAAVVRSKLAKAKKRAAP